MSIDGEEGHRLVTNWLEILDNWRSDPQDNNFLRVVDCVQIQFDGITWVARLERKIMDKLGLKYIPASVKRYDKLRRRKSIESGKKIGPPYRGCVWQILQYHRSICKKVIQKSQKQRNLRTRCTAEEIEVTRRQLEKKTRTPQEQRREWLQMNPLGSASNPLPLGESDSEEEEVSSMFAMIDYYYF
ncbi:hypothetical protein ACA910_018470 [Epithemia clementina (nom. ined.)]